MRCGVPCDAPFHQLLPESRIIFVRIEGVAPRKVSVFVELQLRSCSES